jgi:hypothetical protein
MLEADIHKTNQNSSNLSREIVSSNLKTLAKLFIANERCHVHLAKQFLAFKNTTLNR